MATQHQSLTAEHQAFIRSQRIFFVATAGVDSRVNLSPKGGDTLRILDSNRILWLNLTGSGNESAAHINDINRMTIMWCAFEGAPQILRAYGKASIIHPHDEAWGDCIEHINPSVGARQFFVMDVDLVQTSCGYGVPLHAYQGDRDALQMWSEKRGAAGIADYWREKNVTSLDGLPTGILNQDDH